MTRSPALFLTLLTPLNPAAAREVPHGGEVPVERQYRRLTESAGGPVQGRSRRRSVSQFKLWELKDGTVVRFSERQSGSVVRDRRFDATGWPLTTVYTPTEGLPRGEVHTIPGRSFILSGWAETRIAGGTLQTPTLPLRRPEGGTRFHVLGGEFDVWTETDVADVFSEEFARGLVAGCGCVLIDEAAMWVDGRPGKRFRLEMPGPQPPDQVDLWAAPTGTTAQPTGVWFASYRVAGAPNATIAMAPGRLLISLITLNRWSELPEEPTQSESTP